MSETGNWVPADEMWLDDLGFADCVCGGGPCARCRPERKAGQSMDRLDAIKARAEAATEGPWSWSGRVAPVLSGYAGTSYRYSKEVIEAEHHGECGCRSDCQLEVTVDPLDAEFIASARSDVPRLVAALESVLKLHSLYVDKYGANLCDACSYASSESVSYPCEEVQTVERALKEEQ